MIEQLMNDLERHEGRSGLLYRCPAGKLTIGVGHNIEDRGLPPDIIDRLLALDINGAIAECEDLIPNFYQLSENRQRALANMMFNLGYNKFKGFKKMLAALVAKDYTTTAREMLNSRWAHQVGDRAVELANLMIEG